MAEKFQSSSCTTFLSSCTLHCGSPIDFHTSTRHCGSSNTSYGMVWRKTFARSKAKSYQHLLSSSNNSRSQRLSPNNHDASLSTRSKSGRKSSKFPKSFYLEVNCISKEGFALLSKRGLQAFSQATAVSPSRNSLLKDHTMMFEESRCCRSATPPGIVSTLRRLHSTKFCVISSSSRFAWFLFLCALSAPHKECFKS